MTYKQLIMIKKAAEDKTQKENKKKDKSQYRSTGKQYSQLIGSASSTLITAALTVEEVLALYNEQKPL